MPNRILALDPHGAQLIAVVVETSFRSYQVVGYYSEPRDPGMSLGQQLRGFLSRNAVAADTVLSALPGDAASFRILDLPFRDARRLSQTVPFELESQVPFAVDDGIVDFQVLARRGEGARVIAALVPKRRLEEHLAALAEAGLDPSIVDFAPLASLNVLQLFDGDRPARYGFVHVGGGRGTVAVYQGNQLESLRVVEVGTGGGDALAREIAWSLKAFRAGGTNGAEGPEIPPLLVGGPSDPAFLEALRSSVSTSVQRLEDMPLRRMPASLHGRQGTYAPALGLALRQIADEATIGLNFRRDEFAYRRRADEARELVARLGSLAAVVAVLFFVWQGVSYFELSREYRQLRAAVQTVFKSVLPNVAPVDEVEQLTQEIRRMQKQQLALGAGPNGPITVLDVLQQMSERAPSEPRVLLDELSIDTEGVHVRGKTQSFEAVEITRKKIAESPLFPEVQVKDPRSTPDGRVEFRMNLSFPKAEG